MNFPPFHDSNTAMTVTDKEVGRREKKKKNAKTDRPPKGEEPHVRWRSNPIRIHVVVPPVTVAMGEGTSISGIYSSSFSLLRLVLLFLLLLLHYPLLFSILYATLRIQYPFQLS